MEETPKRKYPIPILILFLLHFAPAVTGFLKLAPIWTSAARYPSWVEAAYLLAFLVGWLFHFFGMAVLAGQWKRGYFLCAGAYLLLAVLSLFPSAFPGNPLAYLLRLALLALPSARDYFGFEDER